MRPDRLDSLLQQHVWDGPREPVSPECLGIGAILRLLDHPGDTRPEELEHLSACRACQRAVVLARRDREILEASWSDETADKIEGSDRAAATPETQAAPPRTIKLSRWLTGFPARAGIAAAVVLAVGLGWWLTRERDVLGSVSGQFKPPSITRADSEPERKYFVTVELKTAAHLTFLYLDSTRKLKLPRNAVEQAEKLYAAGLRPDVFSVTVTHDPPGRQWIAAVASERPFDPVKLRDELQGVIEGLPNGTPIEGLIGTLERTLDNKRPEFSFRGHRFDVPAPGAP